MSGISSLKRRAKGHLGPPVRFLITLLAVMWAVEVVDLFTAYRFDDWGIRPRSMWGLVGVVCSPFLHGGFTHLIANTIPLFILGVVIGLRGLRNLVDVTLIVGLIGGAAVWLMAPKYASGTQNFAVHIGASGLVFGYFGYLITRGFFDKSVRSLLVGVIVLLTYGGLFWGVLPTDPGVSWQGHLFGFIAGAIAASTLSKRTSSFSIE
ncbi:MAG: rhomboid family intramembrane serine protease [Planctomycetaceae bacterium]